MITITLQSNNPVTNEFCNLYNHSFSSTLLDQSSSTLLSVGSLLNQMHCCLPPLVLFTLPVLFTLISIGSLLTYQALHWSYLSRSSSTLPLHCNTFYCLPMISRTTGSLDCNTLCILLVTLNLPFKPLLNPLTGCTFQLSVTMIFDEIFDWLDFHSLLFNI